MTNVPQTDPAVAVQELGHVVLYVRDLRRSIAFYRDVLGWRQVGSDTPGLPFAAFSGGRTHHELLLIEVGPDAAPIPSGRRVGMYHFGLKFGDSDDDLRAVLRRIRDAGVTVLGATDHTVTHSLYVLDPDGNELELYVDVPGVDWREHPELLTGPPKPLAL
ncbi:MAG TPA: VOC family protein [Acidimicrobiales bacterium]|nr:VOC family protein [Acidimicrobiales bacterium]